MADEPGGSRSATLVLALGVAAALGLAVAGGSIFTGAGTEASTSDALPYAAMGAVAALAVAGAAFIVIRVMQPDAPRPGPWPVIAGALVVALLGALLGTALTPRTPDIDEVSPLPDDVIDERAQEFEQFGEQTQVRPVDFDGDGEIDLDENGDPILAFDEDGDGRPDGFLQPCPDSESTERRPGLSPIDYECDGTIDEWVAFDETPFENIAELPPFVDEPLPTIPPEERAERVEEAGPSGRQGPALRTLLIALAVLAAAVAIITYIVRKPDAEPERPSTPPPPPPPTTVAAPMERSLDAMLVDADPRRGICVAYGVLLEQLAAVGRGRRPEEGPEEHLRRCFDESRMDAASTRELLDLFTLARFSSQPVTEAHRDAAIRAMRASIDAERPVGAAGADVQPGPT